MVVYIIFGVLLVVFSLVLYLFQKQNIKLKVLEEKHTNLSSVQSEFTALQAKNDELSRKLAEANASVSAKEQQISGNNSTIEKLDSKISELNEKNGELNIANSTLTAQKTTLQDRLDNQKEEIVSLQNNAMLEFKDIASKILDEKTAKFTETNKLNIENILNPLAEKIKEFKEKIESTHLEASNHNVSLKEQLGMFHNEAKKISNDANNLANALKGDKKKQGDWGETLLESILQYSGLEKDREYLIQKSVEDEESGSKLRPDVIVKLPDNREIVIDSKVSLVAYDQYSSAENNEAAYLSAHVAAIENHIKMLSGKDYAKQFENSLDFTMMFIPIEPAYMLAMQHTKNLWGYAYSKKIVLVGPTTLMATLKIIEALWKKEKQNKSAMEIVKAGASLYDKLAGFVENFQKVGKNIVAAQNAFSDAEGQLQSGKGNAISLAEKFLKLGVVPKSGSIEKLKALNYDDSGDDETAYNKSQ